MRGVAEALNQKGKYICDENKWVLAGLAHDKDYDKRANNPNEHSVIGAKTLEEYGFDSDIVYAIKAHNHYHNFELKKFYGYHLFFSRSLIRIDSCCGTN